MTQDYNLNINVAGGLQNAMDANAAFVAGEGGGAAAQSLPLLLAQKQAVENIRRDFAARVPPLQALFKGMGIEVSFKSLLKQSQIFTSTIGALFQMFGAMIDMTLAPFTKYIVRLVEKFAEWIPKIGQAAEWAEKYIFTPLMDMIKNIRAFIRNPGETLGPALMNLGIPDWLNPWSEGGGADSAIGVFLDNAITSAVAGTALLASVSQKFRNFLKDMIVRINPFADLDAARLGRTEVGAVIKALREMGYLPQAVDPAVEVAEIGIRTMKPSMAGKSIEEITPEIRQSQGVLRAIRDRVVKGWNTIDRVFRARIDQLQDLVKVKFNPLWDNVAPALARFMENWHITWRLGGRGGGWVGVALTALAAFVAGTMAMFKGGGEEVARQGGRKASPVTRAISTLLRKYGSDVDPGVLAERGMTPVADMPASRLGDLPNRGFFNKWWSSRPGFLGGGEKALDQGPAPFPSQPRPSMAGRVVTSGADEVLGGGGGFGKYFRILMHSLGIAGTGWMGADQINRDRQTQMWEDAPDFWHASGEKNVGKRAVAEAGGFAGFDTAWGETTKTDLITNTIAGTAVGLASLGGGFWTAIFGQIFQEALMTENNRMTGQRWQEGTLIDVLDNIPRWLGMTDGGGGGSTTNVTVNFPDGRQESSTSDDGGNTFRVSDGKGGFVEVETSKNATTSLAASSSSDYGVGVFD